MNRLNEATLALAAGKLTEVDADFNRIVKEFGLPPLWHRPPGFETLLYIILEQQVSLASARATYRKLKKYLVNIQPEPFLKLTDDTLKRMGFSRQKSRYGRELANSLLSGKLILEQLSTLPKEETRARLKAVTGIGDWTVDIYLMEALLHPDIWPAGDLAMMKSFQQLKNLPALPARQEAVRIGRRYQPWRSVAARLLWHYYIQMNNLKVEFELLD